MYDPFGKMYIMQLVIACIKCGYNNTTICKIINHIIRVKKLRYNKMTLTLVDWYKRELYKEMPELKQANEIFYNNTNVIMGMIQLVLNDYQVSNQELKNKHRFYIYNFGADMLVSQAFNQIKPILLNKKITK